MRGQVLRQLRSLVGSGAMSPGLRPWVLLLAVPAVACGVKGFVRYPADELRQVKNPHSFRGKPACQLCHVDGSKALLHGPVDTCLHCHQARHTPGHEVGTLLAGRDVGGLPLPEGRIVCHTCHDPHDVKREPNGLRQRVNDLCLSCHKGH